MRGVKVMTGLVERVMDDYETLVKGANTREERAIFQSARLQAELLDQRLAGIERAILLLGAGGAGIAG
jgi:hypothetical protein